MLSELHHARRLHRRPGSAGRPLEPELPRPMHRPHVHRNGNGANRSPSTLRISDTESLHAIPGAPSPMCSCAQPLDLVAVLCIHRCHRRWPPPPRTGRSGGARRCGRRWAACSRRDRPRWPAMPPSWMSRRGWRAGTGCVGMASSVCVGRSCVHTVPSVCSLTALCRCLLSHRDGSLSLSSAAVRRAAGQRGRMDGRPCLQQAGRRVGRHRVAPQCRSGSR